jgi:cell division protein FtsB
MDKEGQFTKLERFIKDKDYELEKLIAANRRLEDEVKHLSDKFGSHEKGYQEDYDRKFEELK